MDRAVLQALVARRDARLLAFSPPDAVQGAVFEAVCGLSTPTIREVAHWTDLTVRHVKRAVDRLVARGLVEPAGRVVRNGASWQTFQAGAACRISC